MSIGCPGDGGDVLVGGDTGGAGTGWGSKIKGATKGGKKGPVEGGGTGSGLAGTQTGGSGSGPEGGGAGTSGLVPNTIGVSRSVGGGSSPGGSLGSGARGISETSTNRFPQRPRIIWTPSVTMASPRKRTTG